jgi:hypothetical protein
MEENISMMEYLKKDLTGPLQHRKLKDYVLGQKVNPKEIGLEKL